MKNMRLCVGLCALLALAGVANAAQIKEITRAPERFIGKQVDVSGKVDWHEGNQLFTLSDDRFFENVLPVLRKKSSGSVDKDQVMTLTGVVRMMDVAEVEREIGSPLDDNGKGHFLGGVPVLVVEAARNDSSSHRQPGSVKK